jgi:hypothetical protein
MSGIKATIPTTGETAFTIDFRTTTTTTNFIYFIAFLMTAQ